MKEEKEKDIYDIIHDASCETCLNRFYDGKYRCRLDDYKKSEIYLDCYCDGYLRSNKCEFNTFNCTLC